MIQNLLS